MGICNNLLAGTAAGTQMCAIHDMSAIIVTDHGHIMASILSPYSIQFDFLACKNAVSSLGEISFACKFSAKSLNRKKKQHEESCLLLFSSTALGKNNKQPQNVL